MLSFVARRFVQAIVALLFVTVVVFLMSKATGDPVGLMVGPTATEEQIERLRRSLGLLEPLHVQYTIYLRDIAIGDFGESIRFKVPVMDLIAASLPASAILALTGIAFGLFTGIPLGVLSAIRRGSLLDVGPRFLAILGQSAPHFLIGIILIQIFAVQLRWFPVGGLTGPRSLILPALTVAFFISAGILRLVRTGMLELLDSEFIKFARVKGVSELAVIWKHALRNALISVVSFTGLWLALLVSLNVVTEVVFTYPGMGSLLYNSILFRDFPVTQGVSIVIAAIVLAINFLVDIAYVLLDPRLRVGKQLVS